LFYLTASIGNILIVEFAQGALVTLLVSKFYIARVSDFSYSPLLFDGKMKTLVE